MLACFRCHARPALRISVRAYAASARQSTPNDDIVAMLQECLREYKKNKSMSKEQLEKRKIAVSLAIAVVREHNVPITSAEEARRLKRVGPSISKRIELFLAGDHDAAVRGEEMDSSSDDVLAQYARVPGLGPATAKKLVEAGCMSLPQLQQDPKFLTMLGPAQQQSVLYHRQLAIPVLRAETEALVDLIRQRIPPEFKLRAAGSYRRERDTSSHVALVLAHPSYTHAVPPLAPSPFLSTPSPTKRRHTAPGFKTVFPLDAGELLRDSVLRPLRQGGVLVGAPGGFDKPSSGSWSGVASLRAGGDEDPQASSLQPAPPASGTRHVRLDMHFVPWQSRATALLAATGDGAFVHSLQVRAVKHGMHLNEFGLWRWVGSVDADPDAGAEAPPTERRGRRPKTSALALEGLDSMWELLPTDTEQGIFDALGAEWVEPARRGWEFIERAR